MNNNEIIVIYKEIGKNAKLKKIQNKKSAFENLIGGSIEYIPYENITIIAQKNRENLKPNIYINTEFLSIGKSIKGKIILTCIENKEFKSLSKQQIIEYMEFLKRVSFNYENFDKKYRYIPNIKNNNFKRKNNFTIKKEIDKDNMFLYQNSKKRYFDSEETLKMILGIQSFILNFLKNNTD